MQGVMHRLRLVLLCFLALGLSLRLAAAAPDARPLAGLWRIDLKRSTDLLPWGAVDLEITVDGPHVTLTRHYAAGRRTYDDVTALDLTKPVNLVPFAWWGDNRNLGAYSGGDHTKRVRTELIDGRVLRTSADLVLNTQQGDRAVNILTDYKVSANGAQLTLTELRSTRNQPVVYVFKRIDPKDAANRTTGSAE